MKRILRSLSKKSETKSLVGQSLPKDYLSNLVRKQDTKPEEARSGKYLHVSQIVSGYCKRRQVIAALHGSSGVKRASSSTRLVWALGRAAELHFRTFLIESLGGSNVYGKWLVTDKDGNPKRLRNGVLPSGYENAVYGESELKLKGIVGHVDLIVLSDQTLTVCELKSEKIDSYLTRRSPTSTHCQQAALYHALLTATLEKENPNGYKISPTVKIIYIAKDATPKGVSPYKEYDVEVSVYEQFTKNEIAAGEQLQNDIETGIIPPRLSACQSPSSSKAKWCDVCTMCFQLNS